MTDRSPLDAPLEHGHRREPLRPVASHDDAVRVVLYFADNERGRELAAAAKDEIETKIGYDATVYEPETTDDTALAHEEAARVAYAAFVKHTNRAVQLRTSGIPRRARKDHSDGS